MYYNSFLALDYESKQDTANRNKNYNEIIPSIENYIQKESEPKSQLDEEAYYDLFYIKAKVSDQKKITTEIDNLIQKYYSEKDFLEGVKNTLFNMPKEVNATTAP